MVINKGRIEQQGTPQEVYDHPANAFVYNFLGNVNVFHGRVRDGKVVLGQPLTDEHRELNGHEVQSGKAFIRPHDIGISRIRNGNDHPGIIRDIRLTGNQITLELESAGFDQPIEAEISRETWRNLELSKGIEVFFTIDKVRVFTGDFEI